MDDMTPSPRSRLTTALRRFVTDTAGTLSVETAIILPALCWIYVGSFVWFDSFRMQNLNLKATYTISDMISREPNGIDRPYVNGLDNVYGYLTKGGHPTRLRVSIIECTDACDDDTARQLAVCWSEATTGQLPLTDSEIQARVSEVPVFHRADQLIVTETFMDYTPAFNVGLGEQNFENTAYTRPRLAGQIKFDQGGGTFLDCNNNN